MTTNPIHTAVNGDCNDPNFQMLIAGVHRISQWNFNSWTRNYNPNNVAGKTFSTAYILYLLKDVNCDSWDIEVGPPHDDNEGMDDTNEDIELHVSPSFMVTYSIALFRGIIKFFQPDQFTFYKARKTETHFDIIFKAEKFVNGLNEDPVVVYFGDVSETQP